MKCPTCGSTEKSKVIDSRSAGGGTLIRRRRVCKCGVRFTSYETTAKPESAKAPMRRAGLASLLRRVANEIDPPPRPVPLPGTEQMQGQELEVA